MVLRERSEGFSLGLFATSSSFSVPFRFFLYRSDLFSHRSVARLLCGQLLQLHRLARLEASKCDKRDDIIQKLVFFLCRNNKTVGAEFHLLAACCIVAS